MFQIKVNKKRLNSLDKKINYICDNITPSVMEGVKDALKNTQTLAIRLRKGEGTILTELVNINSGEVKGRVFTDKVNFFWAVFLEYGTRHLCSITTYRYYTYIY